MTGCWLAPCFQLTGRFYLPTPYFLHLFHNKSCTIPKCSCLHPIMCPMPLRMWGAPENLSHWPMVLDFPAALWFWWFSWDTERLGRAFSPAPVLLKFLHLPGYLPVWTDALLWRARVGWCSGSPPPIVPLLLCPFADELFITQSNIKELVF